MTEYMITPHAATQVGYGATERVRAGGTLRKGDFQRTRKVSGYIVTEPDGHQRHFDKLKDAKKWVTGQQ